MTAEDYTSDSPAVHNFVYYELSNHSVMSSLQHGGLQRQSKTIIVTYYVTQGYIFGSRIVFICIRNVSRLLRLQL